MDFLGVDITVEFEEMFSDQIDEIKERYRLYIPRSYLGKAGGKKKIMKIKMRIHPLEYAISKFLFHLIKREERRHNIL